MDEIPVKFVLMRSLKPNNFDCKIPIYVLGL